MGFLFSRVRDTAPGWSSDESGLDEPEPSGAPAAREAAARAALGVPPRSELRPPRGIRLPGSRRSLRIRPEDLNVDLDGDVLRLRFALPRGAFATVLLEELGLLPEGGG